MLLIDQILMVHFFFFFFFGCMRQSSSVFCERAVCLSCWKQRVGEEDKVMK